MGGGRKEGENDMSVYHFPDALVPGFNTTLHEVATRLQAAVRILCFATVMYTVCF